MTLSVYPINPHLRIQERVRLVLEENLEDLPAFEGAVFVDERTTQEETIPWICVRVTGTEEVPPRSNRYNVDVTVQMCEDRMEQADAITGEADTRSRHHHRVENLTALIHGIWEGSSFVQKVTAVSGPPAAAALLLFNATFATDTDGEDRILTEYSFTMLCVSTEQ
jgi:hypothetical protein